MKCPELSNIKLNVITRYFCDNYLIHYIVATLDIMLTFDLLVSIPDQFRSKLCPSKTSSCPYPPAATTSVVQTQEKISMWITKSNIAGVKK